MYKTWPESDPMTRPETVPTDSHAALYTSALSKSEASQGWVMPAAAGAVVGMAVAAALSVVEGMAVLAGIVAALVAPAALVG
jgi:hypothetical protein